MTTRNNKHLFFNLLARAGCLDGDSIKSCGSEIKKNGQAPINFLFVNPNKESQPLRTILHLEVQLSILSQVVSYTRYETLGRYTRKQKMDVVREQCNCLHSDLDSGHVDFSFPHLQTDGIRWFSNFSFHLRILGRTEQLVSTDS